MDGEKSEEIVSRLKLMEESQLHDVVSKSRSNWIFKSVVNTFNYDRLFMDEAANDEKRFPLKPWLV